MDKETFGRFIADMRRNTGMTQQTLAERLHVTNSAVSKWERGLCYPDVALLEELACALGLSLSELIACDNGAAPCTENNMASLLHIANESSRKQRIQTLRNALISVISVILLSCAVFLLVALLRTNSCSAVYIGSQTKGGQNYVYMDRNGDLLRLHCKDQQMFHAIASGRSEQRYTIDYQWNMISKSGELKSCHINDQVLGTPMEEIGSTIQMNSLLGIPAVRQEIANVYPDPNHTHQYIYTLKYYCTVEGKQYDFLTVNNCRAFAYYDYDKDGITELFIVTVYENAPYMLYDTKDGNIRSYFVDSVPKEVFVSLNRP